MTVRDLRPRRRGASLVFGQVGLLVPGLVVLAGCGTGGPVPGTAQSAPPLSISPSAGTPSAPPAGSAAQSRLAALKPCELLSPAERSTAGLTSLGTEKVIGGAPACDWTEPGAFGVTITLDDRSSLPELKVARKATTATKVGTHNALQVADKAAADGTCAVLLGVGESASAQVDVSNSAFSDTALACRRARTVAGLIEPKLP
jgi:hypothetical protein